LFDRNRGKHNQINHPKKGWRTYDRKNRARKPYIRKIQAEIHIKFEVGGVIWFDVVGSSLVFRLANLIIPNAMMAINRATRKAFQATGLSIDRFAPEFKYFNERQAISTGMYCRNVSSKIVAEPLHNQK
jgi:hypothetical protein